MQKDIILCLIGESGSGKTTLAKQLSEHGDFNVIMSYTTRQPRSEDEWGHIFVNEEDVVFIETLRDRYVGIDNDKPFDKTIAYIYYHDNHYWATEEQYLHKGTSVYVIDPDGFLDLKQKVDVPVIGIYLKVDYKIRRTRLAQRDGQLKAMARLANDAKVFKTFQTDWVIDYSYGQPLVQTILEIVDKI